jgi:hypothetical protein
LRELDTNKVNRARGTVQIDALDTHVDYNRLRVAALFALLDHRRIIDLSHWNSATLVLDNSKQVRRTLDTWAALNRRDEVDAQENERDYIDDKRETNKQTRTIKRLTDNLIRMVERQPGRPDTTASTKSVAIRPVPSHTRRNNFGSYGNQPH